MTTTDTERAATIAAAPNPGVALREVIDAEVAAAAVGRALGEAAVEWGVRWPDGSITSCGWMDGPSESWARKSLLPNERFVHPQQQVGEAVVRRTRTIYADHVTDWREVRDLARGGAE